MNLDHAPRSILLVAQTFGLKEMRFLSQFQEMYCQTAVVISYFVIFGSENLFCALSGCSMSPPNNDDTFTTFAVSDRKGKSSCVRLMGPRTLILRHSFEKSRLGMVLQSSQVLLTPALLMRMSILIFSFSMLFVRSLMLFSEVTSRYMHFTRFSLSASFHLAMAKPSCSLLVAKIWASGFFFKNCFTSSLPMPLLVPVIKTLKGVFIN